MDLDTLKGSAREHYEAVLGGLSEIDTYTQLGVIVLCYFVASILANRIIRHAPILQRAPEPEPPSPFRALLFQCSKLLFPLLAIMLLRLSVEFIGSVSGGSFVMQAALAIAILLLFNSFVTLLIKNPLVASLFRWIGIPIVFFHLIGVLDDIIRVLEGMAFEVGNISISAYGLVRVLIFGSLLFWLGRVSNATGQTIIRNQPSLDKQTKEVFAKIFEVVLFLTIFLLILQITGINLTALAVFGGALGVGLGFGLQSIASNFISGIIILMDRSVSVGDYVELEDGRMGLVTNLNMRSTTLETFDGKDIVVPNEKFITGAFTNWTHKNFKQRYRVDFSVSYKTDIRRLVDLVKKAVASHPQVLTGENIPLEELPDCEIDSFGDSGINMFVEFWMEGIDDGRNRVGGDLMLMILETLQHNGIEIPYPQREVRVLKTSQDPS